MHIFEEVLFFKLRTTTKKQAINSTYLVAVGMGEAGESKRAPQKFARFVLFRLSKNRSFNLLCILDLIFGGFQCCRCINATEMQQKLLLLYEPFQP